MLFSDAREVTPDDNTPVHASGFICGGAGDISIVPRAGATPVTFPIVVGQQYALPAYIIRSTDTSATGIVALYA